MIFILGLAGIVAPARASLSFNIGSSGQTTFNSSTAGLTATEIDLLTLATTADGFEDSGTGVLFQGQNGDTTGLEVLSSCTSTCSEGGLEDDGNLTLSIIIPSNYIAVSFNVLTSSGEPLGSESLTVSATGFNSQGMTTEENDPQFVGAVTTGGISNLQIIAEPGLYAIDDVTVYSQSSEGGGDAPDAPTLLLLGTGLILLGAFRLRRRRSATLS